MANSLYNQLQNITGPPTMNSPFNAEAVNQVKGLMNLARGNVNPIGMLSTMLGGNPQFQGIMQALNQGVQPRDLFYQTAAKMGINPEEVLKALR